MKNLVDAREFDAFKKKVLDPGILTEYEVLLHGRLQERDGKLPYFKIPPETAVVMFNLPAYETTVYFGKNWLSENEKKKLRTGNLAGRNPEGKHGQYAYSVMYVSGDTVPDVSVSYTFDERLGKKGTGIFNASGKRLNNPKEESLSAIISSLGRGLYFVASCRPVIPTQPGTRMKYANQVKKMQLMNLIARSRQRPHSPGTNMRLEPYTIMREMPWAIEITKLSFQMSGIPLPLEMSGNWSGIVTGSGPGIVVERILFATLVTIHLCLVYLSIVGGSVVTGVVRLPINLFTIIVIQIITIIMHNAAVHVTRRGHRFLTSLARRRGDQTNSRVTRLTLSGIMKSARLNPNNTHARAQIGERLLRKYGFNVGNARDIERKFYIHMQRIPLTNRKLHAELNLAKRFADNRTSFF